MPSEEEDAGQSSEDEEQDQGEDSEADARHEAMLAEVRGGVGDRKRKRAPIANEAYPDSEYNLPPTSGSAGTSMLQYCVSAPCKDSKGHQSA